MLTFAVYLHTIPPEFNQLSLEDLTESLTGNDLDLGASFEFLEIPASMGCMNWVTAGIDLKTGFGFYGGRWLLISKDIQERLGPNFPGGNYVIVEVWDQS